MGIILERLAGFDLGGIACCEEVGASAEHRIHARQRFELYLPLIRVGPQVQVWLIHCDLVVAQGFVLELFVRYFYFDCASCFRVHLNY